MKVTSRNIRRRKPAKRNTMQNKSVNTIRVFRILRNMVKGLDKMFKTDPIEEHNKIQGRQIKATLMAVYNAGVRKLKTVSSSEKRIAQFLSKELASHISQIVGISHRYKLIFKTTNKQEYRNLHLGTAKAVTELIKIQKKIELTV